MLGIRTSVCHFVGFPGSSAVKNPPTVQEMQVRSLGLEDPLEKEMATHSSILAQEIPWTEEAEAGGLQSMGCKESDTIQQFCKTQINPQEHGFLFLLLLYHMACWVLVTQPEIEPGPLAVEVWKPNHWIIQGIPTLCILTPYLVIFSQHSFSYVLSIIQITKLFLYCFQSIFTYLIPFDLHNNPGQQILYYR